ncbi:hypothetical protein Bbelb_278970, partial [Branchiostoma belcheri]
MARNNNNACIVTHHRALNATARPSASTLPGPTTGRVTPSSPTTDLRGRPGGLPQPASCPGPTIGLHAPRPDHRPSDPSSPTTGRRGHPPSAWPAQRMSPTQPPAKPDHRLGRPPAQQK